MTLLGFLTALHEIIHPPVRSKKVYCKNCIRLNSSKFLIHENNQKLHKKLKQTLQKIDNLSHFSSKWFRFFLCIAVFYFSFLIFLPTKSILVSLPKRSKNLYKLMPQETLFSICKFCRCISFIWVYSRNRQVFLGTRHG